MSSLSWSNQSAHPGFDVKPYPPTNDSSDGSVLIMKRLHLCASNYILLTISFAPLVSKELTGDSITDLIRQNWIGGFVAVIIIAVSTCALHCYIRGRRGRGQGRQGGRWTGGRDREKDYTGC